MTTLSAFGLYWLGKQLDLPDSSSQALAAGCLAGILITPDLDVDQPVRSHYVVLRKYGPMAAAVWRMAWLPYALAIGHRSWVSHFPVVGTVIRVAYLSCVAAVVTLLSTVAGLKVQLPTSDLLASAPPALIGLAVSDAFHWAADQIWSAFKHGLRHTTGVRL